MASPVKRPYDASRRQQEAEQTRRRIIDAAQPLFVDQGYEGTSMRQLADAAGASLQTLYNTFSSKYGLFSALVDVIVAGDHEPVALADRPQMQALDTIDDPAALVRASVATSLPILDRLNVIFPVLRAAAASDPQVAEGYQRYTIEARYQAIRQLGRRLEALAALAPGVSADQVADIAWTVLSPDAYHLLVTHRGWTAEAFGAWATRTLLATVLHPGPGSSDGGEEAGGAGG